MWLCSYFNVKIKVIYKNIRIYITVLCFLNKNYLSILNILYYLNLNIFYYDDLIYLRYEMFYILIMGFVII